MLKAGNLLCGLWVALFALFSASPALLQAQGKQEEVDLLVYEFEEPEELEDFFHPGVVDL